VRIPVIVDGEIIAVRGGRPDFRLLHSRMHVLRPPDRLVRGVPVQLYLFAVLQAGIIRLHTRYRRDPIEERTREKNRTEKLLESAQLTELTGPIAISSMQAWTWVATLPAHDHRWGWDAGSAGTGGSPKWCA
jgi:ATP-dependent DNA ligase